MTIPRTCDVRRDACDYREWVACGGMFKRWEGAGEAGALGWAWPGRAGSGKRGGLQQLAQLLHLLRKHRRHATAHRHPVQGLRNLHRAILMRHHNQLRTLPQLTNHL